MAQVPFLTNIILYKNVPLAPNYLDTIYFAGAGLAGQYQQAAWFHTYEFKNYQYQMFQRSGDNRCRVEGNPRQFTGVNYMSFKNVKDPLTETGRPWFAFVLDVEYVNENVVELVYEIDVMQTFMFDYDLLQCYVERQHSETDSVGDNLLKEPIAIGDYVLNEQSTGVYRAEPKDGNGTTKTLQSVSYVLAITPLLNKTPEGSIKVTQEPVSAVDKAVGSSAQFTFRATGDSISFQWYMNIPIYTASLDYPVEYTGWVAIDPNDTRRGATNITEGGHIVGSTLSVTQLSVYDNVSNFKCIATDVHGFQVESDTVALSVVPSTP